MTVTRTITLTGATPGNRAFLDRAKAALVRNDPIIYHGFMFRVVAIDKDRMIRDNLKIELEEMT